LARTMDEAVSLARQVGFPVAVKLASRSLIHKTEVGGVMLNLQDQEAVRRAFQEIQRRMADDHRLDAMDGVIVQPMVSGGVELMVGVTQDPLFGPLIAFGLGGIHVEILRDVCFRITPLTDRDASEMIRSIRGFRLLEGGSLVAGVAVGRRDSRDYGTGSESCLRVAARSGLPDRRCPDQGGAGRACLALVVDFEREVAGDAGLEHRIQLRQDLFQIP
jgi:hypothetical protein